MQREIYTGGAIVELNFPLSLEQVRFQSAIYLQIFVRLRLCAVKRWNTFMYRGFRK